MAKKQPKNFVKILNQRTLAETWFCKTNSNIKQNEKNNDSENNFVDDQGSSGSEFVLQNSQSKLRKQVNQTTVKSARKFNSSTKKVNKSASDKPKSKKIPRKTVKRLPKKRKTPVVKKKLIKVVKKNPFELDSHEIEKLSRLIAAQDLLENGLEYCSTSDTCQENVQVADESECQEEQDPLCIDEKEKNKISEEEENKKGRKHKEFSEEILRTLHVKLQHTVPPQHKIENCAGSRPLNEEQIILFESYGPLKRGPFTTSEDDTIKNNWKNFCELHGWDEECVEPFLNMRHEGQYYIPNVEERKNFVRFLSNELPWRSLYSVYFRFKNLYNCVNNGPYTSKEDQKIIRHMFNRIPKEDQEIIKHMFTKTPSKKNKKCAELALILNRKRHSIWQRYQTLKFKYDLKSTNESTDDSYDSDLDSEEECSKSKKKQKSHKNLKFKKVYKEVSWSHPLVSRFIEKLMEIMSCKHMEELKNRTIGDEIWKIMETQMSIDQSVLQCFWNLQLHMQLFCPKPLYLNDLKIDLIEYLYKNKISSDSIEWDKVKLAFNGLTATFLSKTFDHLVKYVETKLDTTELKIADIIEYLYNTHIPELEKKTTDAVLPKLHCKDGRIVSADRAAHKRPSKGTTANPLSDEEYGN